MHYSLISICLLLLTINGLSDGKVYSRCELASYLLKNGIARNQLNDWVCLAEGESGRNTGAINKKNKNGSWDYGIFQINSMYWCQGGPKMKSNDCGITCSVLLSDDISKALTCAKKIYKRHGFGAWYAWKSKCKGKSIKQYTSGCKL